MAENQCSDTTGITHEAAGAKGGSHSASHALQNNNAHKGGSLLGLS